MIRRLPMAIFWGFLSAWIVGKLIGALFWPVMDLWWASKTMDYPGPLLLEAFLPHIFILLLLALFIWATIRKMRNKSRSERISK